MTKETIGSLSRNQGRGEQMEKVTDTVSRNTTHVFILRGTTLHQGVILAFISVYRNEL